MTSTTIESTSLQRLSFDSKNDENIIKPTITTNNKQQSNDTSLLPDTSTDPTVPRHSKQSDDMASQDLTAFKDNITPVNTDLASSEQHQDSDISNQTFPSYESNSSTGGTSTPTRPGSSYSSTLTCPPKLCINDPNTSFPTSTPISSQPSANSENDTIPVYKITTRNDSFSSLLTQDSASSVTPTKSSSPSLSPLLSPTKSTSSLLSLDDTPSKKTRRRSKLSNDSLEGLKTPRTPKRSETPEANSSSSKSSSTPKSKTSTPSKSKRAESPSHRRRRSSAASVSSINSENDATNVHNSTSTGRSSTTTSIPVPEHPANIYRNLLIMEDTYRQEYVTHRKMRRKYLLFNFVMMALCVAFFYAVFIEPSKYGVIHFANRLVLMIVAITVILFYISGSYHKTLGSTRKFIYNSNKAMRGFNVKLVKIPQTWPEAFVDWFWCPAYAKRPGMIVKLVLSARVFNPDIIEGWELYRMEYWDKEYLRKLNKGSSASSSNQKSSSAKKCSTVAPAKPDRGSR